MLQSDAIFVLSRTKNDIAGQKTISRDEKRYHGTYRFYFIAPIKAQVCNKYIYILYMQYCIYCNRPINIKFSFMLDMQFLPILLYKHSL